MKPHSNFSSIKERTNQKADRTDVPNPFVDDMEISRHKNKVQMLSKKNDNYQTIYENFSGGNNTKIPVQSLNKDQNF